jgi:hypothetical protein
LALLIVALGFAFGPHLAAAGPAPAAAAAVNTLTAQGNITTADRTQAGRIIRDWAPSACGAIKNVPDTGDTAAHHYDAYTYANTSSSSQCVTVQLRSACTGSNDVFSMAYLGSFNPANIKANYRADLGLSPGQDTGTTSYSFDVPAGQSFVVTVYEVTANAGCGGYTLDVTGAGLGGGSATGTPVAPTATAVPRTSTPPPAATQTARATNTPQRTPTRTATATRTSPPAATQTATRTPASVPTQTATRTPASVPTNTPVAATATPGAIPGLPCFFPVDNIWNRNVRSLPVHPKSAGYINAIGATAPLHPDFAAGQWNGGPIGIPVDVVLSTQPFVPINLGLWRSVSDPGPYPIPANAHIEGGSTTSGDRHVIVVQSGTCMEYELYHAQPQSNGSWNADTAAKWSLTSNALRPAGWSSADAAGLPILPGLVRYDEVASGVIRHAIRFTTATIAPGYVWPARHSDGSSSDPNALPMGTRLRLKASVNISGFDAKTQVILRALQDYGMILADSGDRLNISGSPDSRWDDNLLNAMGALHASDFEAVDTSGLMLDPNSAQSR